MFEQEVVVTTKYGQMPSFVAAPDGPGQYPGIIFYMDAPGIREELRNMTRRIAKHGYFASCPTCTTGSGTLRFDVNRRDDEMFQCMRAAMNSLTNAKVMDDTAGLLGFIDSHDKAKPGPVGCVGYCMSGQYITAAAATFPHRIKAAASLYGVGIITDKEDSPHLQLDKVQGAPESETSSTNPVDKPSLRSAWNFSIQGFLRVLGAVVIGLGYLIPLSVIGSARVGRGHAGAAPASRNQLSARNRSAAVDARAASSPRRPSVAPNHASASIQAARSGPRAAARRSRGTTTRSP